MEELEEGLTYKSNSTIITLKLFGPLGRCIDDLESCEAVVRRLHGLGIVHGDLNKHNFLVDDGGKVALIDFESAKKSTDKEAMEKETRGIKEQLLTKAFRGGVATGSSGEHY
ncbi:MAG: hypothetical protein M1835_006406 [Candelina submexicana]|nr:MAG: hypothetical protein M1835_006406 [Candelina submexicana]